MDEFRASSVTIPAPRRSTVARGPHSDRRVSPNISIRFPEDEMADIDEAARYCDMTRAEFIRWFAHFGALDVKKQHHMHTFEKPTGKNTSINLDEYK